MGPFVGLLKHVRAITWAVPGPEKWSSIGLEDCVATQWVWLRSVRLGTKDPKRTPCCS